jgi:hypothetical protein
MTCRAEARSRAGARRATHAHCNLTLAWWSRRGHTHCSTALVLTGRLAVVTLLSVASCLGACGGGDDSAGAGAGAGAGVDPTTALGPGDGTSDGRARGAPGDPQSPGADAASPPAKDAAAKDASTAPEPDVDAIPWDMGAAVGSGIAHKSTQNPRGESAAILYAGFNVDLPAARGWATAVYRAMLRDRGVSELWAVQGPNVPEYTNKEIGNSKIAAALVAKVTSTTRFVLVLGHSSGSFVAHELLGQLAGGLDPANVTAGKVVYFDLDGGQSGLTAPIVARLRKAYFVSPFDQATGTPGFNTGTMQSLGAAYPSAGGFFTVDASASGCNAGANECVHVSLVNAHPHDPAKADPAADYGSFDAAHPVEVAYLAKKAIEAGVVK